MINQKLNEVSNKILIEEQKHPEEFKETFSDDELKDVDNLILNEEEVEKRSALFYTLYKSKINQLPKENTQTRHYKKQNLDNENENEDNEQNKENENEEQENNDMYEDDELIPDDGNLGDVLYY